MIDRKQLLSRHNPRLNAAQIDSPLSVGNGGFAFTADITGMQSLYELYSQNNLPLCIMSEWGWHVDPEGGSYTLKDLPLTEYDYAGRNVYYAVDKKPGSEHIYDWLRHNAHKFSLGRISLNVEQKEIQPKNISDIQQTLHLHEGKLESRFCVNGKAFEVITICSGESDTVGFSVKGDATASVVISFPYGHHGMAGADWEKEDSHSSVLSFEHDSNAWLIRRSMDDADYNVYIFASGGKVEPFADGTKKHFFEILPNNGKDFAFSVSFTKSQKLSVCPDFSVCLDSSKTLWESFWTNCGIIDFSKAKDERACELERRMVLSLYLSRIQGCGYLPPAETGLTLNSWYGRFHLEMHVWHSAYLPLFNNAELLKKSLNWYKEILPQARKNAAKNGYKGARWPKMVDSEGIDCPSPIATLLIWQQPHILYMLELIYRQTEDSSLLTEYWDIVKESVDFICDFLYYSDADGKYHIIAPAIPAQEEHDPRVVKNPCFELEYFRFGIELGLKWVKKMGNIQPPDKWAAVYANVAEPPSKDGLYLAHENCPDTFENFNRDHPSMLGAYGFIPGERIDKNAMRKTLKKVIDCWELETMWGWDFAMMAMTATRLGLPDLAIELLLMDTPKNTYVISGNNFQETRNDLPLYLPGNGSLLLTLAMMTAGYEGSEPMPGIPKNGMWDIAFENISMV
ncbi:MAG: glycoside hydrolase family 65 [Oscillospiraceae bacterium]|nr:glycoside hydrolase family 65 [Oscillospiraceae bacterium]MCL2279310.1 glycoside hydrolase family 65 [Oscillospiraceae bacterium]